MQRPYQTRLAPQWGFSLLELLLVMLVIASFVLLSLRYMSHYRWQRDYAQVGQSVKYVMQAAATYFYQHCRQGDIKNKLTLQELEQEGALGKRRVARNPWGSDFTVHFDVTTQPVAVEIKANFNRLPGLHPSPTEYRKLLGAKGSGNEFIWSGPPGQMNTVVSTGLWIMDGHLQFFNSQFDPDYRNTLCFNK